MRAWLPVLAWAAVIFALSSISTFGAVFGTWDVVLLGLAHAAEYTVLGALLVRALRRPLPAFALGILYAVTDELHQTFVSGRLGDPLDVLADAVGVAAGVLAWKALVLDQDKVDSRWA
jgi:VanZ family protein